MNAGEIARYRLLSQHIARQSFTQPEQVVAWLGAMQAQDFPGVKWSIALRLPAATDAHVERAIAERKIVRTWPMRGTLHFVAAADVRWMLELLTPRVIAGTASRQKNLELDATIFARCAKVFTKALQGGRQLSREAMHEVLEQAGISTASQRGYHILWRLSQEGLLCFAAPEGKEQTFALLEEWLPAAKKMSRAAALAELAKRYFTSHGPATVADFVWWAGLKVSDAKAGLDAVAGQLVCEKVDGKAYWMSRDLPAAAEVASATHLLPGFDEYLLGYRDRSAVLQPKHAPKICPGANGVFSPTIVRDGQVVGTWKRAHKKNAVVLSPVPFARPWTAAHQRAIAAPVGRYSHYLGLPVQLAVSK